MEARRLTAAVIAVLSLALISAPARAHEHPGPADAESEILGSAHAAEHAAEDHALRVAARRWARLSPRRQRTIKRRADAASYLAQQLSVDEPADAIGRWNLQGATIPFPTYAINTVQLPTGKVLFWGRPAVSHDTGSRENTAPAYLWDPAHPTTPPEDVTPKLDLDGDGTAEDVPLFCSGQSLLPDGRVFAAGGTLSYAAGGKDFKGLNLAFTFDPWTETWQIAGKMNHGRWYPSQVELADGRIAIYAGWDESGDDVDNRELEIYDWRDGSIKRYPAGDAVPDKIANFYFYPHLFTMPGGKVLLGGPDESETGLLDPAGLASTTPGSAWQTIPGGLDTWYRGFGMGVILPNAPTKAALIGGSEGNPADAQPDAEVIDTAAANPTWGASPDVPSMNKGRSNGNVVILADGSLASVGGGAGTRPGGTTAGGDPALDPGTNNSYTGRDQALKQIELLRPGVDTAWTLGPAQDKWRTYHSTALLLPDGRVLSAGDDYWDIDDLPDPWADSQPADEAELYSPPYLFDGNDPAPRPTVTSAPAEVHYGDAFGVGVGSRSADHAVLVAPGAVTHGNDMNQRYVKLTGTPSATGIDLEAPANSTLAPPGYYMLFVFDAQGTPSVARWVKLSPAPPPVVTPTPTPTASPSPSPTASPAATPTPTPTIVPPDTRAPKLTFRWTKLKRTAKVVKLRLRADEASRATVTVRIDGRRTKKTVRLRAGRYATLRITLTSKARTKLRDGGRLKAKVSVDARDAAGNHKRLKRSRKLP